MGVLRNPAEFISPHFVSLHSALTPQINLESRSHPFSFHSVTSNIHVGTKRSLTSLLSKYVPALSLSFSFWYHSPQSELHDHSLNSCHRLLTGLSDFRSAFLRCILCIIIRATYLKHTHSPASALLKSSQRFMITYNTAPRLLSRAYMVIAWTSNSGIKV